METRRAAFTVLSCLIAASFAATPAARAAGPAAPDQPLPTIDEIDAQVQGGAYKPALDAIGRIMGKGDVAALGYDRHKLLVLKATCQLQLKDKPAVIATWSAILRDADKQASIDDKAEAMAFLAMLKHASGFNYPPRTGEDKTPIDILEPDNRKRAFQALFDDEFATFGQRFASAKGQASLGPMRKVASDFGALQAEERMATGRFAKTEQLANTMADWSTTFIAHMLERWRDELKRIGRHANERVPTQVMNKRGKMVTQQRRRGLAGDDLSSVQAIDAQSQQLPDDIDALNHAFLTPIKMNGGWQDFANQALAIHDHADQLLNAGKGDDDPEDPAGAGGGGGGGRRGR